MHKPEMRQPRLGQRCPLEAHPVVAIPRNDRSKSGISGDKVLFFSFSSIKHTPVRILEQVLLVLLVSRVECSGIKDPGRYGLALKRQLGAAVQMALRVPPGGTKQKKKEKKRKI